MNGLVHASANTYITCGSIPNKLKLPGANFSISCGPPDTSFLESSLNTSTNTIGYLVYLLMNKLISHIFWKKINDPAWKSFMRIWHLCALVLCIQNSIYQVFPSFCILMTRLFLMIVLWSETRRWIAYPKDWGIR